MKPTRSRTLAAPRFDLAAASLLLPLLAACGGGGADAADATPKEAFALVDAAAHPGEARVDASDAPIAPIAPEFVTAKAFAQTDLVSRTCLPGVTIAEAVAKLNAARAVGRMCGTTWYAAAPPLQWNEALASAASAHSQDMAAKNYFSHTSLDGRSPGARITATGYRWSTWGENISAGRSSMDSTLAGWLASPGHCRNIMNPRFKDYGLGCAYQASATYRTYWTQAFGAQRTW
jgi:uncharacterized protein YkwD